MPDPKEDPIDEPVNPTPPTKDPGEAEEPEPADEGDEDDEGEDTEETEEEEGALALSHPDPTGNHVDLSQDSAQPPAPTPPPPAPQTQVNLPIAMVLPSECRRVREQVLPGWYKLAFTSHAQDPAVADLIMTINASLATADQAMMDQNVGQMILANRLLQGIQAPTT